MSTLKVNNIKDASGGTSNLSIDGAAKAWLRKLLVWASLSSRIEE